MERRLAEVRMSVIPVPVMGTQSLVSDSANKFFQLMSDLYVSDYNQTQLYPGKVTSLARLIQQAGSDGSKAATLIQSALSVYFSRYYDGCRIDVTVEDDTDAGRQDQLVLRLKIGVQEQGVSQVYDYMIKSTNSMLDELIRINNTGA